MAGISNDANGRKRLTFVGKDGVQRAIRLGKINKRDADRIKIRVEGLVAAQNGNIPIDRDMQVWVDEIGDDLHRKLANYGLVEARGSATLSVLLERFIASKASVKSSTKLVLGHTVRNLKDYFGENRDVRTITTADGDDFRVWLQTEQKLSEATVRRRCGIGRQIFNFARKRKLIVENPFDGLPVSARGNASKRFFVTREIAEAVMEQLPDPETRCAFALARYGGMRVCSEFRDLTWDCIDWAEGRITVRAPKTEHHEGGGERTFPLFPELIEPLREAFEAAEEGEAYVCPSYRDKPGENKANPRLRKHVEAAIKRAGLKKWDKLFTNLRSTRETELADQFPIQCVTDWIGNTPSIAQEHYLQITDEHWKKAVEGNRQGDISGGIVGGRKGSYGEESRENEKDKNRVFRPDTKEYGSARKCQAVESGRYRT